VVSIPDIPKPMLVITRGKNLFSFEFVTGMFYFIYFYLEIREIPKNDVEDTLGLYSIVIIAMHIFVPENFHYVLFNLFCPIHNIEPSVL
jgi:hypothetical protein